MEARGQMLGARQTGDGFQLPIFWLSVGAHYLASLVWLSASEDLEIITAPISGHNNALIL